MQLKEELGELQLGVLQELWHPEAGIPKKVLILPSSGQPQRQDVPNPRQEVKRERYSEIQRIQGSRKPSKGSNN